MFCSWYSIFDSKDLTKRTISDKMLKERAYENAINSKYDRYQRGLASMVYMFFDEKITSGVNEELAQEVQKPVIKKFRKRGVYVRFKNIIWAAGLADMGSLSSTN